MSMDFEKYKEFYNKYGKTVDQIQKPKNHLSEEELRKKYEKYLKKEEKKYNKEYGDEKWEEVKRQVQERDKNCLLFKKLPKKYKGFIYSEGNGFLLKEVDPAHIFPKSVYPHLKYDVDNVILLSRLFHSRLDEYRDPIFGEQIGKAEHEKWWIFIIGKEWYKKLKEKV